MKRLSLIVIAFLFLIFIQCGSQAEKAKSESVKALEDSAEAKDSLASDEHMDFVESLSSEDVEEMYDRISLGPAPDFTLYDLNRTKISLKDFEGYVILLTFWSMESLQSRRLFPMLSSIHDKYRDSNFTVLAVAMDQNTRENFQEFADFNRLPYPIVYPVDSKIYRDYGVSGPPLSYLIDRKGNIVGHFIESPGQKRLEKVIELFL